MALNFSQMRIANGYLVEGTSQPWCSSTGDSSSIDILDVLPSDPFGMDIKNTVTAITGWLDDLEVDYNQYGRNDIGVSDGNHQLFAGLSFIWNNAMRFQEFPERSGYNNGPGSLHGFGGSFDGDGSIHSALISASSVDEVLTLEDSRNVEVGGSSDSCSNGGDNTNVHPAFGFCLYHLGVKDLISVSMVCKSLHTIVHGDSLLWKHIHICRPLNEKITEDALLHLTERAQGTMQCLRLVDCLNITDDCLKRVLERNPQVVKLSMPGFTRITINGVLSILRDLKSEGKLQMKHLEIAGLFGVTKDHFDELLYLLDIDNHAGQITQKQRFYHRRDLCVSCDDDRALDIEMCPKCQNLRLVYDCPAENCKGKKEGSEECRACSLCISRCIQCGRCINDGEYEETFCLDFLCLECSRMTPKLTL